MSEGNTPASDAPAQTLVQQGLAHHHLGQLEQARACYARVLAQRPDHFDASYLLATLLMQQGDAAGALAHFDRAVALRDTHPLAHGNRAGLLFMLGRHAEALQAYDRAVALKPDYASAFFRRGATLEKLGRDDDALRSYARALQLLPSLDEARQAHAGVLARLGRAPEGAPGTGADSSLTRSDAGFSQRDNAHAASAFLDSVQKLANVRQAPPSDWRALQAQGDAHAKLQQFAAAAQAYGQALALAPRGTHLPGQLLGSLRSAALWDRLPAVVARIEEDLALGIAAVSPLAWQLQSDDPASHLRCSQLFVGAQANTRPPRLAPARAPRQERIKIAYLSADFVQHPVMRVLAEVFELHDRGQFEIHAYAYGDQKDDGMSERLRASFEHYHDVRSASDEQIARHMRDQGIAVAVDLMGHTLGGRLGIFAHVPAPVSVNYIGYPGTLGVDFIDYIVGDAILIPPGHERFYSEQVVRLPACYLPVDRRRPVALAPPRAALGLPESAFVFCAFSHPRKISPEVFALWLRLLQQVPGSVLWLLEDSDESSEQLRACARQASIDPDRLVFAQRVRFDQYLARYTRADLFLDTLPYNALATISDALWVGLPAITCEGSTYVGRGATSILHAAGLPELITRSLADYERLALELARTPGKLNALKAQLLAQRDRCPLNDTPRYTRNLEQAYRQMVDRSRAGLPPAPLAVE